MVKYIETTNNYFLIRILNANDLKAIPLIINILKEEII